MWRSSECHPHTHSDEDNGRLDGTRGDQEESEDFFFYLKNVDGKRERDGIWGREAVGADGEGE